MNTDIDKSKFRKLDGGLLLILQELLHTRSATHTARALDLSQSTISQSLRRLRELFDDPLFVRKPHGLEPTQRALELEPAIAALIDLTLAALGGGQTFDPGSSDRTFTLSAPEYVTATLAAPLLGRLAELAPAVSVAFVHSPENLVLEQLRRGEVACALGRFEHAHSEIRQTPLYADEFCIAVRRGHRLSRGKLTESRYRAEKHIWANSPTETIQQDANFDFSQYRGSIVPRWLTALTIAANSDYVATCPRRLAEAQSGLLDIKLLRPPVPVPMQVSLAHREGARDKGLAWFVDQIRAVAE